ncbi:MAG: hypothetical protein LBR10_14535 [Prevotellaceae bacterium]|jgi:hypothetical protein|nr:hypothetical protein [Prevotellaceae bacterium]
MIKIKLTVSDIPKEKIYIGEKGKYLGIIVTEMQQPDKYGNTHTVYIEQTKEERESRAAKIYIGKGKLLAFEQQKTNATQKTKEVIEDLPF